METKVEITEKYNDTIVCKGKLILIKPSKEELDSIPAEGVKGIYVWLQTDVIDGLPVNDCFKPIIISETETVEAGDTIAHNEFGIGKIISRKATGKYWICEFNGMTETVIGVFKILAMPLDFSSDQLQMIVDGKFNHEDNVWVECEVHDEWLKENPPFAGPYERSELYYQIKLKDNHIILHEVVTPNPNNYPTRCYCGHTTWCECVPDMAKREEETWEEIMDDIFREVGEPRPLYFHSALRYISNKYHSPKKK